MASSRSEESDFQEPSPRTQRRWGLKAGLVILLTLGVGTAAAFQYLKSAADSHPVVEYDKPDESQAAAKEKAAQEQVAQDKQAILDAQTALATAQADWDSAKMSGDETQLAQATANLDQAKARLKAAEDKLKSDDQLRAEAQAERLRVAKILAQQAEYHKLLLGKWSRPDTYGEFRLQLNEEGTGLMTIDFNFGTQLVVGSNQLQIDIQWEVVNGDHVIFDSLRGRPEKTFQFVTKHKGSHRDEVLIQIDESSFSTHEADNKNKFKKWTRIGED